MDVFWTIQKKLTLTGAVLGLIVCLILGRQLVGVNDAGYYQIRQGAFSGNLAVIDNTGPYGKFFADVTTYQLSDVHYFSKAQLDGGNGKEADPVPVQFRDGGKADISGSIRFKLPISDDKRLLIHRDFKSFSTLKHDLIRQTVSEALMQTASIMKAEEMYTSRRGEFTALVEEQIKTGIYETEREEQTTKGEDGTELIEHTVRIKIDSRGKPIIRKQSPFIMYGIDVVQFTIKEIDFDKTIDALIAKKKETEQQKVVAIAAAEKAKQDAITAREQGNAKIAEERATQEVEKIKQVTIAQKEYEVAKLRKAQAEQDAQADITKGKALAEVSKLKVAAGLTPLERATIAKDTAIGVAEQLSNVKFPSMLILGGEKGGAMNPFDAVGLESFLRISKKLGSDKE